MAAVVASLCKEGCGLKRVLTACLLGIVLSIPVSAQAGTPPDPVPDRDLGEAAAFRADFGFPADADTIQSLFVADDTDYSFGGPLAPSELDDLRARAELREDAAPLVDLVTGSPEEFGGLYFTQSNGRLELTVLTTPETSAAAVEAAKKSVPAELSTEFVQVSHTWADLLKAQGAVEEQRAKLGLRSVWPDPKTNGLGVVLTPGSSAETTTELVDVPVSIEYGEGLAVAACSTRTACTPYRGGIKIESPNMFCTWGFYGTAGSAAKYLITAGHCAKLGQYEKHNGVTVTTSAGVDRNTFDYDDGWGYSDSLRAHVAGSPNAVTPFNRIYAATNAKSITGTRATGSQQVGDPVCFAGYATNAERCGTIEQINISDTLTRFDGKPLIVFQQIRMSRVAASGDSGGPVYNGSIAYGTVTAVDTSHSNHMVYSAIRNVEDELLLTVCITSAC